MMTTDITFSKMHGAGNDFIVIYAAPGSAEEKLRNTVTEQQITLLCSRKLGIGADGLFFLSPINGSNTRLKMDFYNCDGSRASMCGNGLRCAAFFASRLTGGTASPVFETDSGVLATDVLSFDGPRGQVRITILINEPFREVESVDGFRIYYGVAGVDHAVVLVDTDDLNELDVFSLGRKLRYHSQFAPAGANVDFVALRTNRNGVHAIRTYERGVEDETLACGTGISSAGAVLHLLDKKLQKVSFLSRSGDVLQVDISGECNILKQVQLTGPAVEVFCGMVHLD